MSQDLSIREAAKYPWSKAAISKLKQLDIALAEVDTNPRVLSRTRHRLLAALDSTGTLLGTSDGNDEYVELTSFFVAKALVDGIGSMFLRRRWATVEAKQAEQHFLLETNEKLARFAMQEFGWQINAEVTRIADRVFSHSLYFANYLAAAAGFHEREWKLVNKRLVNGFVLLRKGETARVLRAAVEKLLLSDIKKVDAKFPRHIQEVYEEIDSLVRSHTKRMQQEIQGEILPAAYPPCMKALLADMAEGKPLSHIARFAITAFLLNIGMESDSIIEFFMKAPDFREDLARYQIEHIAGKRGSTAYTPPSCAYMESVRLCVNKDRLCDFIHHPLAYYRRRRRRLSKPKNT